MEKERAANKAAATMFQALAPKADPFAEIKVLLLPLKVWANQDFASKTLQASQGN